MSHATPAPASSRGALRYIVAGMAGAAVLLGILLLASTSSFGEGVRPFGDGAAGAGATAGADGVLPEGATVFDERYQGIAGLDPALLDALRRAATDARDEGIEFSVTSGWRSREYQDRLLRDAIAEYGSEQEAARWVATADTSAHVSGDAVDLGPYDATSWLSEHGARYGLCQIYANEPWHYELRTDAVAHGCPRLYTDPTEDPRLRG